MSRRMIVYWLIPAPPERELFHRIISILAQQLDAPRFEPHVTLFSTENDVRLVNRILRTISAEPVRLMLTRTQFSSEYTKTLFARFRPSDALNEFAAGMQIAAGKRRAKLGDPHLSLCYKRLSAATKKKLAQLIQVPLRDVLFDRVYAVRCSVPTRRAADVKAWEIIARRKMKSGPVGLRPLNFKAR
jgi:2'-5' RNA ligase